MKSNDEKYDVLTALDKLTKYISKAEGDEDLRNLVESVVANNAKQFQLYLVALIKAKITRTSRFLAVQEEVDEMLFARINPDNEGLKPGEPGYIVPLSTPQLFQLSNMIQDKQVFLAKRIAEINQYNVDTSILHHLFINNQVEDPTAVKSIELGKSSRQRVTFALKKLLAAAEEVVEEDIPVEPDINDAISEEKS